MAAPRSQPNFLAGSYLDRAVEWRKDPARVQAAVEDPTTLWVPVWRTRSLVLRSGDTLAAHFVSKTVLMGSGAGAASREFVLLGRFRGRACFACAIEAPAEPHIVPQAAFQDLRTVAGELPADEAGVLAYARAMVTWREQHRFCGRCGSRTVPEQGGHVLRCSEPTCHIQQFPRIDPAIIVLVHDGERALLGRQASWPEGRYSTLAGFVEPGESLEDAVMREVREETGVELESVEYHSSQPWPFPSSLMVGFLARAATARIDLGDGELEDARWFTRQQLANGEVGLPFQHSISFRLIEEWYDAGASRPLREEPNVRLWGTSR